MSCAWGASFADKWLHRRQKVWWISAKKHVSRTSALRVDGKKVSFGESSAVELARVTTPLGRQMECSRRGQSRWCLRSMRGTSESLLAVKGLPWDRRRADPAARIRLPAPEVPPEHVLPPPVGELAGPRSRRVYIRRDVEIRMYGVTIGCPWCMGRPPRGRIEQKMLEDKA